jgi:hypothetical protein
MGKEVPFFTSKVIAPYEPEDGWELDDYELDLFDSIAVESINVGGIPHKSELYQLDKSRSTRDPLYDEPITEAWRVFKLKVWIKYPEPTNDMRPEGLQVVWENIDSYLPRKNLELIRGSRPLREGDVLRVWKTRYTDTVSADTKDPNAGYFFNITKVDEYGHMFDTPTFTLYKLTLARRTAFTPERRVYNT